jgi:hypothetical protein
MGGITEVFVKTTDKVVNRLNSVLKNRTPTPIEVAKDIPLDLRFLIKADD